MIRKARLNDVSTIKRLIDPFVKERVILPLSLHFLYKSIRDFWLIEGESGNIVACCALQVSWEDLAEIRTLVVRAQDQGKGYGSSLVGACLDEAKDMGIKKLFALTYVPSFFKKMRFHEVDKMNLPHKIWADCINCPYFPDCKEIAMIYNI